jgi:membrane protein implicated in regulation of membrane protease activity
LVPIAASIGGAFECHDARITAQQVGNGLVISRARVVCCRHSGELPSRYRFGREAAFMSWIAWLIAAAALGVAEYFTLTLAFGLLAAAALVAAIVAGVGGPLLAQVLAFAVTGAVGLLIVRPIARRQMTHPALVREGSYALVGKKAVVIEEVTGTQGLIKLSGEVWSARALDEDHVIPAGTLVDVMEIEGATAIVYPRELLP